jgi:hypothetical protein
LIEQQLKNMKKATRHLFLPKPITNCIPFVLAIFLLFGSCRKGTPVLPLVEKSLVVNFSQSAVPIYMVDSAVVIFKRNGSAAEFLLHLEKKSNSLQLNLEAFSTGNWNAHIYIYTKKNPDGRKRLYIQKKSFNTSVDNGRIELSAPKLSSNDNWKAQVICPTPLMIY